VYEKEKKKALCCKREEEGERMMKESFGFVVGKVWMNEQSCDYVIFW